MQERYEHFIGGAFVPAGSGRHLETTNPATGKPLAEIARGDASDVDAAVKAAESALPGWRDRRPIERGRVLTEIARRLRERQQEIAALEVLEAGKPAWQAPFEVEIAAQYFEFYGGLVNALGGETIDLGAGYHSYTRREPFGVVGIILPWNAPINQAARAAAPALAAGNVVVAKPSEFTSASLLELAQLAVECGLPAGALNVVTGTGPEAGAAIVAHGGVRKVAFTGSLRAGREVAHLAADRILPLTLELGGKSPNLVFADADLEQAAQSAPLAVFGNAGQDCCARSRILVERPALDHFMELFEKAVTALRVGDPLDEQTEMGPLISADQRATVASYADDGAPVAFRGSAPDGPGYWFPPTVLCPVSNDDRAAREEIFGPVAAVIPFDDEAEAVRIANDTIYGLSGSIWTRDGAKALRVARGVQTGVLSINSNTSVRVSTPFGGFKQSGYGRELGPHALDAYTEIKSIYYSTT